MTEAVVDNGIRIFSPDQEKLQITPLREDLNLFQGPTSRDGSPTWTLHDPVRNQFFSIGWVEFEMLARWPLSDAEKIVNSVNNETTLMINNENLEEFMMFLVKNQLVSVSGPNARERLTAIKKTGEKDFFTWLLHNYLFFRIPLVKPERFLKAVYPYVRFIYSKGFFFTLFIIGITGIYLVSRQLDQFANTFDYLFNWQGVMLFGFALFLAKCFHEFGHALTATRYGVRVPTMGVAFLVLWPVLYTDTSEAWKLPERNKRLHIVASGMMAELTLAILATFLWNFLPDGSLRYAVLLLASSTWILTLILNLNPFMRFDGYYLLSDYLEVQNLQDRSFFAAKNRLRNILFGFKNSCAVTGSPGVDRFLVYYAYSTWIYRFFLFLGIALLVYYFFFKLLGLFLMMTEIVWFIGKPVYNEVKIWYELRKKMTLNKNSIASITGLLIFIFVLVIPWNTHMNLPAVLVSESESNIYPPGKAQIGKIEVRNNDLVKKGQILFILESSDLEYKLSMTRHQIQSLRYQHNILLVSEASREYFGIIEERLSAAMTEYKGIKDQLQNMIIISPLDGVVQDILNGIRAGMWINKRTRLATIVDKTRYQVEAFIPEYNLMRISEKSSASFIAAVNQDRSYDLIVENIDETNINDLKHKSLASTYGGEILVEKDKKGRLVPKESYYRIILEVKGSDINYTQERVGVVRIEGKSESLITRLWRVISSVFIRESSF